MSIALTGALLSGVDAIAQQCVLYASRYATDQAGLQKLLDENSGCEIVIDRFYQGLTGIRLPRKTYLRGLGPQGRSGLVFTNTSGSSLMITSPTHADYLVLENLDIEGPGAGSSKGLDLTGGGVIIVRQVVIRGFGIGVYGNDTFSAWFTNCNVSANRMDNFRLDGASNSWRIRDSIVSQAGVGNPDCIRTGCYGIRISGGNDHVIDGVRFESSATAAVYVNAVAVHLAHNRFESNGAPGRYVGVIIDSGASRTTLVGNYYSSGEVQDRGAETMRQDAGYPWRTH